MKAPKIAVVGVDVTDPLKLLRPLHKMHFLAETEIHFVHVVQVLNYFEFPPFIMSFPFDEDREKISSAIISSLKSWGKDILPYGHHGKVFYHCLFDQNPKEALRRFTEKQNADLIVVGTREQHGVFESSFTNYLCRHTPTNILIMRPHHEED